MTLKNTANIKLNIIGNLANNTSGGSTSSISTLLTVNNSTKTSVAVS